MSTDEQLAMSKPLTPDEFTTAMQAIYNRISEYYNSYDPSDAHNEADVLMCDLLRSLGYGDGVDIFKKSIRWYE